MGAFVMNYGIDPKGHLLMMDNGKIKRLNKSDGSPIDSSLVSAFNSGRITIGADSVVYVNNTEGDYYALSNDLQTTIWSTTTVNGNYYAGPSVSKEGIMVMCGAGSSIKAYKYNGTHAPVADFVASRYHIYTGQSVNFFDQSSFSPSSWSWEFTGGNPLNSTEMDPIGINYTEPGTYPVRLIATSESGTDTVTKMCYIEVELYEGVEPHTPLVNTRISPNPVREFAVLSSDEASEISIFNSIGKVVYQDKKATRERRINFSDFSSGIYFVQFTGDGFTRSEKLVVGN
jgi:PKD repeat protein